MACKLHLNIKAAKKLYPARGWGALTLLTTNTQQFVLLPLLFLLTPPPDAETSQGAVYSHHHLSVFLFIFPQDSEPPRAELCPRARLVEKETSPPACEVPSDRPGDLSNKNLVISKQSVNFNSAAKHRDQPWRLS